MTTTLGRRLDALEERFNRKYESDDTITRIEKARALCSVLRRGYEAEKELFRLPVPGENRRAVLDDEIERALTLVELLGDDVCRTVIHGPQQEFIHV